MMEVDFFFVNFIIFVIADNLLIINQKILQSLPRNYHLAYTCHMIFHFIKMKIYC